MFFHQILKLQGYPLDAARRQLEQLQAMEPQALHEWQEQQKWAIFRHHLESTGWYREKAGGMPENWADVPVLQKKDYQAPLPALLSDTVHPKKVYIGNTSGSSGHPFFYAKDKYCHALTWANIEYLYRLHGLSLHDKQARFYGIPFDWLGYGKEKLKDWLANRARFPVFDLSDRVLHSWVRRFERSAFHYLYGYTSALVYFARFCISQGLQLKEICPTLRTCVATSELCTPEDQKTMERGFGIPVVNEYGASEADVIAFSYPGGDWRISAANIFLEIVDEAGKPLHQGQEGRILITALHNRAMPVIRYEIGDIGITGENEEGYPILQKLLGRVNDMISLPSGRKAAGLTFYYISRSILEKSGILREFIIRQTALDTFVLEAVTDRALTKEETAEIKEQMDIYLEPGLKLIIHSVPFIERKGLGKIKHFFSEISE